MIRFFRAAIMFLVFISFPVSLEKDGFIKRIENMELLSVRDEIDRIKAILNEQILESNGSLF